MEENRNNYAIKTFNESSLQETVRECIIIKKELGEPTKENEKNNKVLQVGHRSSVLEEAERPHRTKQYDT